MIDTNLSKFKMLRYMFENHYVYKNAAEIAEGSGVPLSSVYAHIKTTRRLFNTNFERTETGHRELRYTLKDEVVSAEKSAIEKGISMFSILLTEKGYDSVYKKTI